MKKHIIYILLALFAIQFGTVHAQDKLSKKEQRQLEKAQKKQEKKKALRQNKEAILEMINNYAFVIEANTIQGNSLYTHQVSNNNFIMVDGEDFVLQTANNFGFGYNGLGGITITGEILDLEIDEGKGDNAIRITAQVSSSFLGHSTVFMTIGANGNSTARLTDNWGNRIALNGDIYPLEESIVYQGQSLM